MRSPARNIILGGRDYASRWGLVEHWRLDEPSGNALGSYGGNTLTDNNTVTSAVGKVGGLARQFTAASSEYLSRVDNAALSGADVDLWVAAWAFFDALGVAHTIVGKRDDTGNQREYVLDYVISLNAWRWLVSGDGAATATPTYTGAAAIAARWYFVMSYHDAVNNLLGLSVNGGAWDTVAHTTGVFNGTAPFHIGSLLNAGAPTNFMDGKIGPVYFGKSPSLGIGILRNEIRDRLYSGGAGKAFPWR